MTVRNKKGADIGNSLDHFPMVATVRVRTAIIFIFFLARTPEIEQGLGRILSCGARKPEQT